jgi:hypothetical protein
MRLLHTNFAVECAQHLMVIESTDTLHPGEDTGKTWMIGDLYPNSFWTGSRQILQETPSCYVSHALYKAFLEQWKECLDINLCRSQEGVSNSFNIRVPWTRTSIRESFLFNQLPDLAKFIAVNSTACESKQDISCNDALWVNAISVHCSYAETSQIIVTMSIH